MNKQYKFLAFVASASMLLAACGAAATPTAVPPKPDDTPKPAAPAATPVSPLQGWGRGGRRGAGAGGRAAHRRRAGGPNR